MPLDVATLALAQAIGADIKALRARPLGANVFAYNNGKLVSVTASDGTVKTLNYTNDVLTSVVKVKGTETVTKTLTYLSGGTLDKITTAVTVT